MEGEIVSRVLHLGEVSGVAGRLSSALNADQTWAASHELVLPKLTPGDPAARRKANGPLKAWQVRKRAVLHIEEHQPDLVHVHWARLAPFMPKMEVPRIIHAHGSDVRRTSGPFAKLVLQKMREFDCQIASTPDLLDFMPSTTQWLPNPVNTDFFKDDGEPEHEPFLFVFARFMEVKGANLLLDACRQVRHHLKDLKIVGIAGGEFDREARDLGVTLVPFIEPTGIRNLLLRSSLVVGQQKLGILSLAELETMSMRRPLLTNINRGLYEDHFRNLAHYPKNNLGDAILEFYKEPESHNKNLQSLREDVEKLHSFPAVTRKLKSLYQSL